MNCEKVFLDILYSHKGLFLCSGGVAAAGLGADLLGGTAPTLRCAPFWTTGLLACCCLARAVPAGAGLFKFAGVFALATEFLMDWFTAPRSAAIPL